MRRRDPLGFVFEACVVLAGTWTVTANLAVLTGAGLGVLRVAAVAPLVVTVALLAGRSRLERPLVATCAAPPPRPPRLPWQLQLAAAAAWVGLFALTGNLPAFWLGGVVLLGIGLWSGPQPASGTDAPEPESPGRLAFVLGLAALAAALTSFAHRVDVDDTLYLNIVVDAVGHPTRPLLAEDWMYGERGWPLPGVFYRVAAYELGVAALASWLPLAPAAIYYLVLPPISAALVVLVHWLALREFGSRGASVGLVLALLVLLAWGDTHTTYGNFGFVRLFQGKAVLASAGVLAVLVLAQRWMRRRDLWSWLLLALAQTAALGLSSSGLLLAPLVSGCALLGSWRPGRDSSTALAVGLLGSGYVVAAGMLVALGSEGVMGAGGWPAERALDAVIGEGPRGSLALFALLALPAVLPARQWPLAGYAGVAFVLLFNPWTPRWVGAIEAEGVLAWRIFWAVPLPFVIGALGASLVSRGPVRRGVTQGSLLAGALALAFAFAPGTWTLSSANRVELDWPRYKVAPGYETAYLAVARTPPGGLIAAPFAVSFWLPTVPGDVRPIAIRPGTTLRILERARGPEEAELRFAIQQYLDGDRPLPRSPFPRRADGMELALREIERRRVDTVVVPPYLPSAPAFEAALGALGYGRHQLPDGHRVWTRR